MPIWRVEDQEFSRLFASELRRLMAVRHLTAKQLATRLSVSRQALYQYLRLRTLPSASVLFRAARLGMSITYRGVSIGATSEKRQKVDE